MSRFLPSRTCSATASSGGGKRRKAADAFLQELATLSPGDLVVHADHGIGRYEGLTQIPVSKVPHDCVALEYARGDKLYVPVENIELLSRYGSESEGVSLDSLGGEAWQRRKARMKERIREIAGELIKTAALRATRPGIVAQPDSAFPQFVDRFPYEETDDQERAIEDVLQDLEAGKPMDRLVCGDVGFGKTEVALRAALSWPCQEGRWRSSARPLCSRASITGISSNGFRVSRLTSAAVPAGPRGRGEEDQGRDRGWHGRHRHRDPRDSRQGDRIQAARPRHRRRGAALRSDPQGAAQGAEGQTCTFSR